ncbi:MAG: hypothetical protein M1831_002002 [Alyxoria varia]|nr:MAG: hypothetical protein M1831_002002 [Alyxoria varia]
MSRTSGEPKPKSLRRRSLGAFAKLWDESDSSLQKKPSRKRSSSIFQLYEPAGDNPSSSGELPKPASRSNDNALNIPGVPREPASSWKLKKGSSLLESLKNFRSNDDNTPPGTASSSKAPSVHLREPSVQSDLQVLDKSARILHHGEAQIHMGMLRKRREYLVLTESQLIRFKSQAKASESFPEVTPPQRKSSHNSHASSYSTASLGVPPTQSKSSPGIHGSSPSTASKPDSLSEIHTEKVVSIPLEHVVAVYLSETIKEVASLELAIYDGNVGQGQLLSFFFTEADQALLWVRSMRYAAKNVHASMDHISEKLVEYAARAVEQQGDYDPSTFRIYKVVKRQIGKSRGRSSGDDLNKLNPSICLLVIGMYSIHLISLPKKEFRLSSTSLADSNDPGPFGIMTLTSIEASDSDDGFSLTFRVPFQRSFKLHLASIASINIALRLKQVENFLRHSWRTRPYHFQIPEDVEDDMLVDWQIPDDGHTVYDRTLIAYCRAYGVDSYNVRYAVQDDVGDAPRYKLHASLLGREYSNLELLAILRSLRYSECFTSISFADICMDSLNNTYDHHGAEHSWPLEEMTKTSLLMQEVRALATSNRFLRRMDFSSCITGTRASHKDSHKDGCGIVKALHPVCTQQETNVDWIALNNIKLAVTDLDYFYAIATDRGTHFRAIEARNCGLNEDSVDMLLDAFKAQAYTLEAIDISQNSLRLYPQALCRHLNVFDNLKVLDLSHLGVTGGSEGSWALLPFETLRQWHLEELRLSGTALNSQSIAAISTYVASAQSGTFRELILRNCSLDGEAVAQILESMVTYTQNPRPIHLDISGNPIRGGHPKVARAIARQFGPRVLTMRYIDYQEADLADFLLAMAQNKSIIDLDISRLVLPGEAGEEVCQAFAKLFSDNETLEALNMAGEDSRLERWALGAGINYALESLQRNKTLKVLEIQDQQLRQQGANTLAELIRKNRTLQCLYCENNGITLSGFTDLVDALSQNTGMLYLPTFDEGRMAHLGEVQKEIMSTRPSKPERASILGSASSRMFSMRRSLAQLGSNARGVQSRDITTATHSDPTTDSGMHQDDDEALKLVNEQWNIQVERLDEYLERNKRIAAGFSAEGSGNEPEDKNVLQGSEVDEHAKGNFGEAKQAVAGRRSSVGFRDIFGHVKEFGSSKEADNGENYKNSDATGLLGAVDIDVSRLMEHEIIDGGGGEIEKPVESDGVNADSA